MGVLLGLVGSVGFMSDVALVALVSGQWLLGRVEDVGDEFVVGEPFEVISGPAQTAQGVVPQIGVFPFAVFAAERKFRIRKSKVLLGPVKPDDNLVSHWREMTSGLVTSVGGLGADGKLL